MDKEGIDPFELDEDLEDEELPLADQEEDEEPLENDSDG
jgi:hypothetical protein